MSSPEDQSLNNEALETVNQQLYQLVKIANIDMEYQVLCVVVDLLRAGICPEAMFVFLSKIYPYTRVGMKLATLKKSRKNN